MQLTYHDAGRYAWEDLQARAKQVIRQHTPWVPESLVFLDIPLIRSGWNQRLQETEELSEGRIYTFGIRNSDDLCGYLGRRPPDGRHLLGGIAFRRDTDCVQFLLRF